MESSKVKEIIQIHNITSEDLKEIVKVAVKEVLIETGENTPKEEKLITRIQAAEMLMISLPTLHVWVNNNILPAYRMGNRVYFKRSEIEGSLKKINI